MLSAEIDMVCGRAGNCCWWQSHLNVAAVKKSSRNKWIIQKDIHKHLQ